MKTLSTETFDLAVYAQGDQHSERLALVLPGRLETKDYPHMRSLVDRLAAICNFALSFVPTGSCESSSEISDYTLTNYKKAINEVISAVGKPTLLAGHSRGGSMAMLVGPENPHVYAYAAIMSHTAGSLAQDTDSEVELVLRDTPPNDTVNQIEFKLPRSYFLDAAQYDVIAGLRTCKKPKLFIAGGLDDEVSTSHVYGAYLAAGEPKSFEILENVQHNYRRDDASIARVTDMVIDFARAA